MGSRNRKKPSSPLPELVLEAFVTRARRIAAHSLAQDREQLQAYSTRFKTTAYSDGRLVHHRSLPDEERFESLAARIRPLMLPPEKIFYPKVVQAISLRAANLGHPVDEDHAARLDQLADSWAWLTVEAPEASTSYVERSHRNATRVVAATRAQLGGGWFYNDVAHNDPTGPRKVALEFPMSERYAGAVQMFSALAAVVLDTLDLIKELDARASLDLPPSTWTKDVTVQTGEIDIELYSARFAPVGTPLPPPGVEAGPEWTVANLDSLALLAGQIHVTAQLRDEDGGLIASWPTMVHRTTDPDGKAHMALRVGDLAEMPLPDDPDVGAHEATLRFDKTHTTNASLLRQLELQRDLHLARTLTAESSDGATRVHLRFSQGLGSLGVPELAAIDACSDLVAIEQLTGTAIEVLTDLPDQSELITWRVFRLVLEGQVTKGGPPMIDVESSSGQSPRLVRVAPHEEMVNGHTIRLPAVTLWHPNMVCTAGERPGTFQLSPPPGEMFSIWAPDLQADDFDPTSVSPASWDLAWMNQTDNT